MECASTPTAIEALGEQLARQRCAMLDELSALIDERQDWPAAAAQVSSLMFVTRLGMDIDRRLDAMAA